MTKAELINLLLADLEREKMHMNFYLFAASQVVGLHREEIGEFFFKQAQSEMTHVKQFQDMILEIGGRLVPSSSTTAQWCFNEYTDDPRSLLKFALDFEDEVVQNYVQRIEQAASIDEAETVDGTYVALFLEDQLLDSKGDAANIRRMLKGV